MHDIYQIWQKLIDFLSKCFLMLTGFSLPISVTGFNIFLGITAILFVVAGKWKEKIAALHNPVFYAAMFFLLILVISIPYSTASWDDIWISLGKYSKLLYLIIFIPLFTDDVWKRRGVDAFLAAMIVTLVASYLKMFGLLHIGKPGLGTIFTNHIITSFMMAFATFIIGYRCLEKNSWRWFYVVLFILFVFHLFFMNEGRTGLLVFLGLIVLFLWQRFGWKGLVSSLIAIPVLFAGLLFFSHNVRQGVVMIHKNMVDYHKQELDGNSIGLRRTFTENSLQLIKAHPLVGTGVGSFHMQYKNHFPPAPGFADMHEPQNEYLLVAVQIGIIGLMIFLALFYIEWRASLFLPEELKNLAQGMIVAFLIGSICDSFLYHAMTGYFFVYFSGLFFSEHFSLRKTKRS